MYNRSRSSQYRLLSLRLCFSNAKKEWVFNCQPRSIFCYSVFCQWHESSLFPTIGSLAKYGCMEWVICNSFHCRYKLFFGPFLSASNDVAVFGSEVVVFIETIAHLHIFCKRHTTLSLYAAVAWLIYALFPSSSFSRMKLPSRPVLIVVDT